MSNSATERAFSAFLAGTDTNNEYRLVLRGLTLHMLSGHAWLFFYKRELATELGSALGKLSEISLELKPGMEFDLAMSRIDACYLLDHHKLPHSLPDFGQLEEYMTWLVSEDYLVQAWLLGELAKEIGINVKTKINEQELREGDLLHYLYWLTHLFFLKSKYLSESLPKLGWMAKTNEIIHYTPWVVEHQRVDIGAEMAICLQLAGERKRPEHQSLIELINDYQEEDGRVIDPSFEPTENSILHTTAAALIALAGAES